MSDTTTVPAEPESKPDENTSENHDNEDNNDEIEDVSDVTIPPQVIEDLSIGVLGHYLPNLQKAKSSLDEVLKNQTILLDTIHQENCKFSECNASSDMTETMLKAKKYYQKLNNIKKEMQLLEERSFKLKKRSLKLQQQKQKEEFQREQQREKEYEREKMLTATVAKPAENKSSS